MNVSAQKLAGITRLGPGTRLIDGTTLALLFPKVTLLVQIMLMLCRNYCERLKYPSLWISNLVWSWKHHRME